MRKRFAILAAAGMLMPVAAQALDERPWLMLNGGGGTYVMSDLNAEIDAVNAAYAGTGWSFGRVEGGRSFGGAMGFETASRWNFGLGVDRLDASTRASDASGSMEYRLGANAWRAFGEYSLRPVGHSSVFVGGSLGIIQENGRLVLSSPGTLPEEYKISGNDPMFEGYAGGNWWVTPRVAVTTTVGYRYARVKEVKVDGFPLLMTNGAPMSLDFSGPAARVGIKLAGRPVNE